MKVDVVVVGSGITGLTAGSLLAKNGKHVAVLERQKHFGGAIRQFRRKKISFDVGFHYTGCLGNGEILDLIWSHCGVLSDIDVLPVPEDVYDHYEFNNSKRVVRGYFSYDLLGEELIRHFPSESQGIDTYFTTIRQFCSNVPFYNPELPLTPFLRGYKSRPRSLSDFLDSLTLNNKLRSVLGAPAFLYGVPINRCTVETHALVAHGYYSGAFTIKDGGQAVVDAFCRRLHDFGAELMSECEVASVVVEKGEVAGVDLTDGRRIECDNVIFTGHPANLISLVPLSVFRPAYRNRLLTLENSLSLFAVFGESEKNIQQYGKGLNYYLLPGEGEILPDNHHIPLDERPIMLTSTGGWGQQCLQPSQNGIIMLCLGYWADVEQFADSKSRNRPGSYEQLKIEVAEKMLEIARQRWGDPCGNIEPLAVGTPLTFRDELSAPEGCAYGAMHCLGQFNPEVRTRLPGLYLCGQSTLMTGVVGASISGLVGAGEILGLEQFWESLR